MTALRPKNYTAASLVLASAVADDATFTVAYPSGTTQGDFDKGLANLAGCYVILNDNDRWAYADPGINLLFGASEITVTNRSGYSWPAGTKVDLNLDVKEGNRRCIPLILPALSTITAADILTEMELGIEGDLEYAEFVTTVAASTADKLATLGFEIGSTAVTGMTLGLTTATVTPKGKVLPFGLPTAAYTLSRSSKLSLVASSVTAFSEGQGYINLYIRESAAAQDRY